MFITTAQITEGAVIKKVLKKKKLKLSMQNY